MAKEIYKGNVGKEWKSRVEARSLVTERAEEKGARRALEGKTRSMERRGSRKIEQMIFGEL